MNVRHLVVYAALIDKCLFTFAPIINNVYVWLCMHIVPASHVSIVYTAYIVWPLTYRSSSKVTTVLYTYCYRVYHTIGDQERILYMRSINAVKGLPHKVDRSNIYEDVLDLYREGSIVGEHPILIKYVGEKGVDEGGVQRDMFSAFWEQAYSTLFEGSTTLIPMVHPLIDISLYTVLGRIVSHGYLTTGILPDRIALPTLIQFLLGPGVSLPQDILLDAFIDYISATERQTLKTALDGNYSSVFPNHLLAEVTNILSHFGNAKAVNISKV